ncbi:MAG: dolichyl-phosphate beta-glucosyltransferase [Candidatus Helarchaeota archaeon]
MNKIKLEIDLPVFNEEKILEESVEKLRNFLHSNMNEYNFKIVIIDNGSNDKTPQICKNLKTKHSDVDFLHLKKKGRGRALRTAWENSGAQICSYMDIDLSTDLKSFPSLISSIAKDGYDVSTGSRLIKGAQIKRSLKREILSRGYVFLLKRFLGISFSDAQCGFKAINKKTINKVMPHILDQEWFFDSELLFKSQRWGYKIKEIPVKWIEDPDSKVKIYKTIKNYLMSLLRLKLEFSIDRIKPND